eukprot:1136886-Pelagomonas_calceolata.AAC.3
MHNMLAVERERCMLAVGGKACAPCQTHMMTVRSMSKPRDNSALHVKATRQQCAPCQTRMTTLQQFARPPKCKPCTQAPCT